MRTPYYNYFNERKPSRFSAEAVPASIPFLKIYQEHFGVLFSCKKGFQVLGDLKALFLFKIVCRFQDIMLSKWVVSNEECISGFYVKL